MADSDVLHTCTSDLQQPCVPCTALYLRLKRSIDEGEGAEIAEIGGRRSRHWSEADDVS